MSNRINSREILIQTLQTKFITIAVTTHIDNTVLHVCLSQQINLMNSIIRTVCQLISE